MVEFYNLADMCKMKYNIFLISFVWLGWFFSDDFRYFSLLVADKWVIL